jgi:hypothetical protein
VSRVLAGVSDEVVKLGAGRSSRYALAQPIGKYNAQQPIWWVDEAGAAHRVGLLSLLERAEIHVAADGLDALFVSTAKAELPWYLMPLRAQGYLGKVMAQSLALQGLDANPERWGVPEILLCALRTHDAPGALLLGDAALSSGAKPAQLPAVGLGDALDAFALDVAANQSMGSSAGGEQPKFLAQLEGVGPVLVKFSPPRNTPFGARWSDLLLAEAQCNASLAAHGFAVANSRMVQTAQRTYLISTRFDRVGQGGRMHVVSVGAAHAGWVKGSYTGWAATGDALHRQGRLGTPDAHAMADLAQFGRLIGNTDMHSGNASLFVKGSTLAEISKAQFALAPVYDMLPMRWRPSPELGLSDYAPFDVQGVLATPTAARAARHFWQALAAHDALSPSLRDVAQVMELNMPIAPAGSA